MSVACETRAPNRRRIAVRFSLRLLMFAVTAAAGGLGFWKAWVYPYRAQREAIRVFQEAGGTVQTRPGGPAWLRRIAGEESLTTVVHVDLINCPVTDECLAWLLRLPDLEDFQIGTSTVGVPLPIIPHDLRNAEYLNLSRAPITDAGLAHLRGCTKLTTLFLSKTQISDEGLKHLKEVCSLRIVWLYGTKVTPEGARELQSALPGVYVGY